MCAYVRIKSARTGRGCGGLDRDGGTSLLCGDARRVVRSEASPPGPRRRRRDRGVAARTDRGSLQTPESAQTQSPTNVLFQNPSAFPVSAREQTQKVVFMSRRSTNPYANRATKLVEAIMEM